MGIIFLKCILFLYRFQGGNATFPNILNNFVHVLMYFYYMLSAMGPQYQKYLWWKKWMTEIQIVSNLLDVLHYYDFMPYEEKTMSLGRRKKVINEMTLKIIIISLTFDAVITFFCAH